MIWIAPSEKDTYNAALEKRLWDAADQFRDNSRLQGVRPKAYCRKALSRSNVTENQSNRIQ